MNNDARQAIQDMFPLDTPVENPIIQESSPVVPTTDLEKKREELLREHPLTEDNYDRSKLVEEITQKPPAKVLSQKEIEESRETFSKLTSGKTLNMMLEHLMKM
jgi:hypothetical protein